MRARSTTAALVAAAALALAPAAAAVADPGADNPGAVRSAEAKAKAKAEAKAKLKSKAKSLEDGVKGKRSVVLGGELVSVALEDPALEGDVSTVTFTVHGGRLKPLRGTDFTVTVDESAKVTREGLAELADLVAGDHVVVKLRGLDLSVVKNAAGQWELQGTATAHRVVASPAGAEDEATVAPEPTA